MEEDSKTPSLKESWINTAQLECFSEGGSNAEVPLTTWNNNLKVLDRGILNLSRKAAEIKTIGNVWGRKKKQLLQTLIIDIVQGIERASAAVQQIKVAMHKVNAQWKSDAIHELHDVFEMMTVKAFQLSDRHLRQDAALALSMSCLTLTEKLGNLQCEIGDVVDKKGP